MEHKLKKCEPADPNRCQAVGDHGEGQCCFLAVEGVKYCPKHGGTSATTNLEKKKYHDFLLGQWQKRVDDFSASDRITNLHGELGMIRMQLEMFHEKCVDRDDLLLYSNKIQDLIMKSDKLVNSIDKISNRSGNLLNKSAALALAGSIIDIIASEVEDPLKIERISNGIIDLVAKMAGKEIAEGD